MMPRRRTVQASRCPRICRRSWRRNIRVSATPRWRAAAPRSRTCSGSRARPSGVLRRQPLRLRGAMADRLAGDRRGRRRAHARQARRAVRPARQPRAACATARRRGRGRLGRRISIGAAIAALEQPRRAERPVGVIGPMTFEQHAMLSARFGKIANLNRAYVRLRQIKSAEELDWMRIGAAFTDRGMTGLRNSLRPGLSERDLADVVERSYISLGGTNVIHYFGVTSMFDAACRRADAVFRQPQGRARRHRVRRDQRRVLGASRPGTAQFCGRRGAASTLSRAACGRRRRLRRRRRRAQGWRHAASR